MAFRTGWCITAARVWVALRDQSRARASCDEAIAVYRTLIENGQRGDLTGRLAEGRRLLDALTGTMLEIGIRLYRPSYCSLPGDPAKQERARQEVADMEAFLQDYPADLIDRLLTGPHSHPVP